MSDENQISYNNQLRVISILEKDTDGEPIFLDWNAFDAVSAIKDTDLRDIARRLLQDLPFDQVKVKLRDAIVKKRKEMIAFAKEKVFLRMIDECIRLNLKTSSGVKVTTKELLREYFKKSADDSNADAIKNILSICFSTSPRWKEDTAEVMMERFGIKYDPATVQAHENGKGNGFYEKIITKALCNCRADLRSAQGRANCGFASKRIRRNAEEAYDSEGRYIRKKNKSVNFFQL